MTVDPIVALESLGYTEREAAFLYLVAIHSGYFLRRQFDYFIDRNRGGTVVRFLEKARIQGHVQFFDCAHGRQVYHMFHKSIYRMLGVPDCQNRRVKGDGDVRARLMKLDYVLENGSERFLETDEEKFHFFAELRGIDQKTFCNAVGDLCPAIRSLLISLAGRTQPAGSLVRFVFVDEGLLTTAKFERVLATMDGLLRSIGYFELIYVALSEHNFKEAAVLFHKHFSTATQTRQASLNPDWQRNVSRNQLPVMAQLRPQFTTVLYRFHYPSLRRNELRCSAGCSASALEVTQ